MNAMDDLKWVIFALIVIWIIWFFAGGPEGPGAKGGPFLKPPSPIGSGQTYGGEFLKRDTDLKKYLSVFKDKVFVADWGGGKETDPNREYITLTASLSQNEAIGISGWKLKGLNNTEAVIGQAVKLPYLSQINPETALILFGNERAVVTTGFSPIGVSFQVNKCSGYLGQFQEYYPSLEKDCPDPTSEFYSMTEYSNLDNGECASYLGSIQRCQINTFSLPGTLSSSCSYFINNKLNYNECVRDHKNDPDFYKPEWRIFLGKNTELWKNQGDYIKLYDNQENVVSYTVY